MIKSFLFCAALFLISTYTNANTYYVTTVSDTGIGSLRSFIDTANVYAGADTIILSLSVHDTVHLASRLPTITDSLVISGLPCQNPVITGDSISFTHPAFYTTNNALPLTLNYLNILYCKTSGSGKAGAVSAGYVYINYCFFYGNSNISDSATNGSSGAVYAPHLWAYNSTFSNNTCNAPQYSYNAGAGAVVSGNGHLSNCTFTGNSSASFGGALNGSFSEINNCTIAGNYAAMGGGGLFSHAATGAYAISNNIVWGNTIGNNSGTYLAGIDLYAHVNSGGCNILQDVAVDSFSLTASDITGVDPQLMTLGIYSGCVPVMPIMCGSVAENHATCAGATTADAQGIAAQGQRDAGAFEITHPNLGGDTIDSIQRGTKTSLYNYFNTTGLTIVWPAGLNDSSAAAVDTGAYTIIGTNFLGCSDTATVTIFYATDTLNTGIKNAASDLSFRIYPNPAKDYALLSWTNNAAGNYQLSVIDMMGRTVISQQVQAGMSQYAINTSALPQGIYTVMLGGEGEPRFAGKLVVLGK